MNTTESPLHEAIHELCLKIEELPASEQQTKISVMASTLDKYIPRIRSTAILDFLEKVAKELDKMESPGTFYLAIETIRRMAKEETK